MVASTRLPVTGTPWTGYFGTPLTGYVGSPLVGAPQGVPQPTADPAAERAYLQQVLQGLAQRGAIPGLDLGRMQQAQAGQTLGDLAQSMPGAAGLTQEDLVQALIASLMNPQQLANILQGGRGATPGAGASTPVRGGANVPMPGSYTVKSGDTLSGIARRFGVPLNQLIAMNPQIANPNLIYPDQQIRIPNGAVMGESMGVNGARANANANRGGAPGASGTQGTGGVTASSGPLPAGYPEVTADELKRIMPHATDENIRKYLGPLNRAMAENNINTKERQAAFLSQVAVESGSLRYSEEIASGAAYEGRRDLGNTQPGDGKRFKGRGLIQLTGRANYESVGRALGVDLVNNPQLAESPEMSARIAAHFFKSRGLNEIADRRDIGLVSRRVNGGTNGLSERIAFFNTALAVLA